MVGAGGESVVGAKAVGRGPSRVCDENRVGRWTEVCYVRIGTRTCRTRGLFSRERLAHVGAHGVKPRVGSRLDPRVRLHVAVPLARGAREVARGAVADVPVALEPSIGPRRVEALLEVHLRRRDADERSEDAEEKRGKCSRHRHESIVRSADGKCRDLLASAARDARAAGKVSSAFDLASILYLAWMCTVS